MKTFFFGLRLIFSRKTDWFWMEKFLFWSSLFSNFLNFLAPLLKILRTLLVRTPWLSVNSGTNVAQSGTRDARRQFRDCPGHSRTVGYPIWYSSMDWWFCPVLFGRGGAGVYVTCSKCNTSNFLSFSTGPIASCFTAETFALEQGLDWSTNHLMTCKF